MDRIYKAFFHSLDGLKHALLTERAVRQEAVLLIVALPVAIVLAKTAWVFAALIGSLLAVVAIELLNTAIEKLSDHVTPERHDDIKIVKDLGSAAVLMGLLSALLVWITAIADWLW